jgi:hypothetical protein
LERELMLLALALLASQVPPPPSGRVLPPDAVEILDPIAPMVARYEACLTQKFNATHPMGVGDPDAHRNAVNQAIAQCVEVRRTAVAEADRALARAPDYRNPAKRDLAIRHAFEGTEHVRRELVALLRDRLLPGMERTAAPPPNVQVPRRVMPAAMRYMSCMTDGLNAVLALDGDARQAKAAALDADCRATGLAALPRATIGDVTHVSPTEVAALNKAMDEMGASIIENFVGPKAAPKGVPGKTSESAGREIIR